MKTTLLFQTFTLLSRWIAMIVCGLAFLLTVVDRADADYIANSGTTFLNMYFTPDGTATVSPTVSPYSPSQTVSTVGAGTPGVGTPLTTSGVTWLTSGSGPYPGAVFANWESGTPAGTLLISGGASALVSYQQASYFPGSNSIPSSGVSPFGTSLSLNNTGTGTAELRLDWTTTYTYNGPAYSWSPSTTYGVGANLTDPNNNFEVCTASGTSGGGTPGWPLSGAASGTLTHDGTATWTVFPTFAPGNIQISISGSVGSFSAMAGQESFSVNGAPVTSANTATIPLGGDFSSGIPGTLEAFTDNSLWSGTLKYLYGFQPPTTTFYSTIGAQVPSPLLIHNNDTLTVRGYLDTFVDPGSIQVQISAPVNLGITTYNHQPVVLFPASVGTNYVLQMSTNLATDNWVNVTNGVPFTGIQITNPPSPAFFRLY